MLSYRNRCPVGTTPLKWQAATLLFNELWSFYGLQNIISTFFFVVAVADLKNTLPIEVHVTAE